MYNIRLCFKQKEAISDSFPKKFEFPGPTYMNFPKKEHIVSQASIIFSCTHTQTDVSYLINGIIKYYNIYNLKHS